MVNGKRNSASRRSLIKGCLGIIIAAFVICMPLPKTLYAADMGDSLIRDYPISLTIPKQRLELSLDYIRIDDTIDILGIRDAEIENVSRAYWSGSLSDMYGGRAFINYGLFPNTTLMTSVTYRDMDYGLSSMKVKSFDLSIKHNLNNKMYGNAPFFAVDAGVRYNYADDMEYSDINEINVALKRFAPNISMRMDSQYIWFDRKQTDMTVSYGIPKNDAPAPELITKDMSDITPYLRLTTGKIFENFFPNLFLEYGYTLLDTSVDFSLKDHIPESYRDRIPELPIDLSRNEHYLKTGICLLWKRPYRFMGRIEYSYLKLFRDDGLDYIDDNHVLKAEINIFLTKRIIFNIGGIFYQWQFNGIIPFMYNQYTQTTFDHHYGRAHAGLTFLFDL